jgi:hypothetical protein
LSCNTRRFDDQLAGAKKMPLKRENPLWQLAGGFFHACVPRIAEGIAGA